MEKNYLSRILIRSAMDKWLREIDSDPRRTIRKLVDLGRQFSKGNNQQSFFSIAARMLEDEESAYYRLITEIVRKVDHETIKTYGFNLAYNSWTAGADIIREKERELGYNIPWALFFEYDPERPSHMPIVELHRVIAEGRELGIYSYFIYCKGGLPALQTLCEKNADCAFTIFLNCPLERPAAEALAATKNAVTVIPADSADFGAEAALLRESSALFGAYLPYGDADEPWLEDRGWVDELVEAGCVFVFLSCEQSCGGEARAFASKLASKIREEQRSPIFAMEFYSDFERVDRIISDQPCFMGVSADGIASARTDTSGAEEKLWGSALGDVLAKIMPRTGEQ